MSINKYVHNFGTDKDICMKFQAVKANILLNGFVKVQDPSNTERGVVMLQKRTPFVI